jgi:hypothetical protein
VTTPDVETLKLEPMTWKVLPELPMAVFPEVEANVVAPVEVRLVKVPAAGVVAPMAVELIPVEVVVKWPEVKLMSFDPALIDEAERFESAIVPELAVKFKAPVVNVKPSEAVKVSVEVKGPLLVVVTPVAPRLIAAAVVVPILIAPEFEVPVPAWILTEPPVEVEPDSFPAFKFKAPPVPEPVEFVAGWRVNALPPVKVVISGEAPPATARMPFSLIVSLFTPPDWISKLVLVAPFESLRMKAGAVPALVRVKLVATPESDD